MAMEAERIGARMRERRTELGLKQREVADRIAGSTEGKDVSRWENGKHRPQGDTLDAIATALQTTVDDLYAGPRADREAKPTPDLLGTNSEPEWLPEIREQLAAIQTGLAEVLEHIGVREAERAAAEAPLPQTEEPPESGERRAANGNGGQA